MNKKKIILLVEDNPDDQLLTIQALRDNQINNQIEVANDGLEALDFLFGTGIHQGRNLSVMPHLILLDLKLPKIDGIEVLQKIRANENTKFLPVIILTSSTEEQDLIKCYKSGANSYIRKPVDFNQFTKTISQLGIYWLVMNELPPLKTN